MKKRAIFVFQSTPCFPMGGLYGSQDFSMGKGKKYVEMLNQKINELGMKWEVLLDESMGDISEIKRRQPDILICVNGLQKRFFIEDFKKEDIIYLSSLELYSMDHNRVIRFMKLREN